MKQYIRAAASDKSKYKQNLNNAVPKIKSAIRKLEQEIQKINRLKTELKTAAEAVEIVDLADELNIQDPERFEWFLDSNTVSDEEADKFYDKYDEVMDLIHEYENLAEELDRLARYL